MLHYQFKSGMLLHKYFNMCISIKMPCQRYFLFMKNTKNIRMINTSCFNNSSKDASSSANFSKNYLYELPQYAPLLNNSIDSLNYLDTIAEHLKRRKSKTELSNIRKFWTQLSSCHETEKESVRAALLQELLRLPNTSCPHAQQLSEPKVMREFGEKRVIANPLVLEQLSHHGVDMKDTGNFTGMRSYYLRGSMARLEHKLIRYAVKELLKSGFRLMSVPDLVTEDILLSCGVPIEGERTMVYTLDNASTGGGDEKVCLSGTAEIAIGGWLRGRHFSLDQLPLKLCAVSRCYRAEADANKHEHGIYRVHNFTKVEMFGVTAAETGQESNELYEELVSVQERLLQGLGLHGKVILMPPEELGNPAYSKTDVEVWLPGRGHYAELTSASNCTNYQSARLGITYTDRAGRKKLVHTVNGTAVAVPRCIIALCETHQEEGGRRALQLPKILGISSLKPDLKHSGHQHDSQANNQYTDGQQSLHASETGPEQPQHHPSLDKVMVYKEQCIRKSIRDRAYLCHIDD
uniref:serine--tRNA ligase n=1 Tax=Hirondellea gigas TaxID=1518452 RepID=A0A2P2HZD6_9CRUS